MSEYLTYTLWRQREERMPHELEQQRVVRERLSEQARLSQEEVLGVSQKRGIEATAEADETDDSTERTETAGELEPEFANR